MVSDEVYQKNKAGETSKIQQIEHELQELQLSIDEHRSFEGEFKKCWYFGLSFFFDYGPGWSSCEYWRSLISANHKICTDSMHFEANPECCPKCSEVLKQLEELKN